MEAGDEDNLINGGRAHLPACDGERGAHWNHEVPFAAVEDGRSHRNANHQTWGSERRRVACENHFHTSRSGTSERGRAVGTSSNLAPGI